MQNQLVKRSLNQKDFEYVFVYKLRDDWAQLPPPIPSQKKKPSYVTVLVNIVALSLKKMLAL